MNALIFGRRRQGKSTLSLVLAAATGAQTILILDPNDQYGHVPVLHLADLAVWLRRGGRLARIMPEQPVADFAAVLAVLDAGRWAWADWALVVDESSYLQRPQAIDPEFERLMRQSPADIHLVQNTHRVVDTHNLVRALATDVFIFATHLQRDLDYLALNFGPGLADRAATLAPYQVIHWWVAPGGAPAWQVWNEPQAWYYNIGRDSK